MKSFVTKVIAVFRPPEKKPQDELKYFGSRGSAHDAQRLWTKIITTLPADVLTRAYAAVLQVLSYDSDAPPCALWSEDQEIQWALRVREPLIAHFRHCGLIYAVAAFLITLPTWTSPWRPLLHA